MNKLSYLLLFIPLTPCCLYADGNPVIGEKKAEICIECHAIDGDTKDQLVPKLNGQYENFLYIQTMQYVTGARFDTVMGKVINKVKPSAEDISDISAYYSRLPMMSGDGVLTDNGRLGRDVFFIHQCNFCHNDHDDSVKIYISKTARVGGQNKGYLYKSLKDIQEGIRKADNYNLMNRILKQLTDNEIDAVAEFLSTL
ncbi:MAG: hypothetical protein OEY66_04940 [Gammaproteobacteria bacterium]|nr:hypothetical protein [Gammaproteobacteria bacterium]